MRRHAKAAGNAPGAAGFLCAALLGAALWGSAGCASMALDQKPTVEFAPGMDLERYRVFGVVPFKDGGTGKGRALAEELRARLKSWGREAVPVEVMEREFRAIKTDSAGLSLFDMSQLARKTRVEVLVTGTVGEGGFSLKVVDLSMGEELVKANFPGRDRKREVSEMAGIIMGLLGHKEGKAPDE